MGGTYEGREWKVGGGSGRTYGKGRRGRRWQGDDPICCSSVGVSSDLMGNLNCVVGCFWIGRDEGSFRWNMEWVVGKREGRSAGELGY